MQGHRDDTVSKNAVSWKMSFFDAKLTLELALEARFPRLILAKPVFYGIPLGTSIARLFYCILLYTPSFCFICVLVIILDMCIQSHVIRSSFL